MLKNEIAKNLSEIKKKLKTTQLIAVSKYSPVEDIVTAYKAHHYDFGENRVKDLKEKADYFQSLNLDKVRWHFIGNLQSNKVRELYKIPNLYAVHSVDSISLLEELIRQEKKIQENELQLFFQINTSHELEKNGFSSAIELDQAINLLMSKPESKLKLYGLMTMGTIRTTEFEVEAMRCFIDLKAIAKNLEKSHKLPQSLKLSMGMSQDYKLAIEAGSDFIRVGSAIFKP